MIVTKTIDELCHVGRGRVISNQYIKENPGSYPVYSSQTANNGNMGNISTFDFDGEYVTWTTDGANAGTIFYRNGKFNCTNICGTLKAKNANEIDMQYLALALSRHAKEHVIIASGNPKLMNNTVKRISISFPESITTQKTIVADVIRRMAAIDAMAEKTTQQITDAECYIERVNKETITFSGISKPLSEFCAEDKQIIQPTSEKAKTLMYLGMENIDKDTWAYVPSTDIAEAGNSTTYYFGRQHLLYGKLRPYLKKVFLPDDEGRCSTELIPLLPNDTIEREYLALLLTDNDVVSYIMQQSTGSRMPRTDMKKLLKYRVQVPDIDEQRRRLATRQEKTSRAKSLLNSLHKQQENLSALRACIFREAFGNEE